MRNIKKTALLFLVSILLAVPQYPAKAGVVASIIEGIATEPTQIMNNIELMGINIAEWVEIAQQLEQLAHEVEMIENQLKNLESYGYIPMPFINTIEQLSDVVEQGQILSYVSQNIDADFAARYPGYDTYRWQNLTPGAMRQKYTNWSMQNARNIRTALKAANIHEQTISDEKYRLETLGYLSQAASGNLKVTQTANMIALEQADSLQRLRQLVMVNSQLHANYMANEQDKDDMSQAKWEQLSTSGSPIIGDEGNILGGIQ